MYNHEMQRREIGWKYVARIRAENFPIFIWDFWEEHFEKKNHNKSPLYILPTFSIEDIPLGQLLFPSPLWWKSPLLTFQVISDEEVATLS